VAPAPLIAADRDREPAVADHAAAAAAVEREPLEQLDDPFVPVAKEARRTGPAGSLRFGSYQSIQVNVDDAGNNIVGDAANEPSIAVDPTQPNRLAIGWRQFDTITNNFRQAGIGYSSDGGRSWTFPGVLDPGVFRSDPVLEAAADGTFYYNSLSVDANYWCDVFTSGDGGSSWGPPVYAYGGDKAWMAVDRTGGIGDGNIYAAWDYAGCCGDDWFNRSTDGAQSFEYPAPIPSQPYWGVTAVGPDGTVYVVGTTSAGVDDAFAVALSTTIADPGAPLSFNASFPIVLGGMLQYFLGSGSPNPGGLLGQVWIAADHSGGPSHGNVYVLASVDPPGADPLDVHLVRSEDGGATWSVPVRVNDDPLGGNAWQWFGTMAVAPNGRIDAIWNDTRSDPGGFDSQLYYAYSLDGGVSWSPNEPLSPAWNPHLGWPDQDKIGDYYDMASDLVGAHVAYAATFNGEQDVYYLRIGDYDCNGNGVGDTIDIQSGTSADSNNNGIPDECEGLFGFADGFESGDTSAWSATVP
jgi:hypothetical protein